MARTTGEHPQRRPRYAARTPARALTLAVVAWIAAAPAVRAAPAPTVAELVARVSLEQMRSHLEAIEGVRRSPEEQDAAADYLAAQFTALGYAVTREPVVDGDNVIARRPAASQRDDVFIVAAHYDTVFFSPGADDNGVAVAGLLEMARVLAGADLAVPIELVAFADEELGLQGSRRYAEAAHDGLREVLGMISLEMIGYTCAQSGCQVAFPNVAGCLEVSDPNARVGDFIAAVANQASTALLERFTRAAATYVPELPVETARVAHTGGCLADTRRSDHAPFWDVDYAALMLTDTANFRNPNYHAASDTIATLDLPFARRVVQAALGTALDAVGLADPAATPTGTPVPPATPTPLPPDARRVLLIGDDNAVALVDTDDHETIATVPFGDVPYVIAPAPDGRRAYVMSYRGSGDRGRIGRVDLVRREGVAVEVSEPHAIAVAPDGAALYVTNRYDSGARTLEVIDTETLCPTARIDLGRETSYPSALALSRDLRRAYISDHDNDRVLVVDLEARRVVATPAVGTPGARDGPLGLELTADGRTLLVPLRYTGRVAALDVESLETRRTFLVHPGARQLALSPDGRSALIGAAGFGDFRSVHLIDIAAERVVRTLTLDDDYPDTVAIGLDGTTGYATGCERRTLVIDLPALQVTSTVPHGACLGGLAVAAVPSESGTPLPTPLGDACPTLPAWTPTATPAPAPSASPAPTGTADPSPTPTARLPDATPTRRPSGCAGDCDDDAVVSIANLLRAVNVALERLPVSSCPRADGDGNDRVTVAELISAVAAALRGCPN